MHTHLPFLKSRLGKELSDPVGFTQLAKHRMVDMFTACTHVTVKANQIIEPNSALRIVIAFGMGLDCPNIRRVFHWGVPSDMESYLQMKLLWSSLQITFG